MKRRFASELYPFLFVSFWLNFYRESSPVAINQIYRYALIFRQNRRGVHGYSRCKCRFKSPLEKTRFYESLRSYFFYFILVRRLRCNKEGLDGPTSISTVDNKRHAEMRRAESPAYATKLFADFEEKIDASCADLTEHLDRCIDAGKGTMDVGHVLQMFAIDAVGELAVCCRRSAPKALLLTIW